MPPALSRATRCTKRNLGRIARAVKHALAEKGAAETDAV